MINETPSNTNAAVAAVVMVMIVFAAMMMLLLGGRDRPLTTTVAAQGTPVVEATPTLLAALPTAAPGIAYTGAVVSQGKSYFGATCSGCHGSDGRGIAGLGKNLVENDFVVDMTDHELLDFIVTGRPAWDPANTTGIDMPARGGNPALNDDNIYMIIAYLRTQADPSLFVSAASDSVVSVPDTPIEIRPTEPFVAPALPDLGLVVKDHTFDPAFAYNWSCAGCHGLDAQGISGYAPGLIDNLGSREDLFQFIITGNPLASPDFPHPVRGEYPTLTDEQINALIDYLYTLPTGQ